mmetsp:Transcript_16966/g.39966  ORF Transcript_16966/g.39966 Transcript_16966/m.39966 type:complete len:102 (+) Transcript_16966:403-708(+)
MPKHSVENTADVPESKAKTPLRSHAGAVYCSLDFDSSIEEDEEEFSLGGCIRLDVGGVESNTASSFSLSLGSSGSFVAKTIAAVDDRLGNGCNAPFLPTTR